MSSVPAAASEFGAEGVQRAGDARLHGELFDLFLGDVELAGEMTPVGDGAGLAAAAYASTKSRAVSLLP